MNYPASFQRFLELVRENDLEERMAAVVSYGSLSLSLWSLRVLSWCRKRRIGYIGDCVDWLSVSYGSLFFRAAKWLDATLARTYIDSRADGVIAVTTYLQDYYRRRGRKTVVIPPLSIYSPCEQVTRSATDDRVQLIYAGIPFPLGRSARDCRHFKDRIDKAISYLYSAYRAGHRFVFHIYGFTRQEFLQALPDFADIVYEMGESLDFGGFLTNAEIMERVRDADFTFLIRDDNRSTRAGFPTKVTESISCGTPVIATRTSDLARYLTDGEQVCWVSLDGKEAADDVVRALSLPRTQIEEMKRTCVSSRMFAYRNYCGTMRGFLESLDILPPRSGV
jgi:glycosyltransferase involved in cell wall biosynthesis